MAKIRTPYPLRKAQTGRCGLSGAEHLLPKFVPGRTVNALIPQQYLGWDSAQYIARAVLKAFRVLHICHLIGGPQRQIAQFERQVPDRAQRAETLPRNVVQESDQQIFLGQRVAGHMTGFGSSWTFISSFLGFLALWIVTNAYFFRHKPFDSFPIILLALFLSGSAAGAGDHIEPETPATQGLGLGLAQLPSEPESRN